MQKFRGEKHIVEVKEVYHKTKRVEIVMEYVPNGNLKDYIKSKR